MGIVYILGFLVLAGLARLLFQGLNNEIKLRDQTLKNLNSTLDKMNEELKKD